MPLYYYFIIFIGLLFIILPFRSLLSPKKNISIDLFNEGLRNENNGRYEEAVINYKNALMEVKKTRFQSKFKNKIIEKLKILHTLIDYNNGVRIIRQ